MDKYRDHLGKSYPSMSAMAAAWGIPSSTLHHRLTALRMPVEAALTQSPGRANTTPCRDHEGNEFPSKAAMCSHWDIPRSVYFSRIQLGWTTEQALTTPVDRQPPNSRAVRDHTGQEFPSVSLMCRHWGMTRSTYNARIKSGWTVEKALTEPKADVSLAPTPRTDHTGRVFPTLNAMCRHYHITKDTLRTRVDGLGWTLERALTEPESDPGRHVTDYMGREFPTVRDMCHFYGFQPQDLQGTDCGEAAFRRAVTRRYKNGAVFGHAKIIKPLGFPWFLVELTGHEYVWDLENILTEYHDADFRPLPESRAKLRDLEIHECVGFPNYRVTHDMRPAVWTYWEIIEYRRKCKYGLSKPKRRRQEET